MYERGGGAEVELYAAQGDHPTFSDGTFQLVGDREHGGLTAYSPSADLVPTDLTADMLGVNSSLYVRVPFTMADATAFESLTLWMRYDDGFVAYLNGVEVAPPQRAGHARLRRVGDRRPRRSGGRRRRRRSTSATRWDYCKAAPTCWPLHGLNSSPTRRQLPGAAPN